MSLEVWGDDDGLDEVRDRLIKDLLAEGWLNDEDAAKLNAEKAELVERVKELELIVLTLTMDHNSGVNYVRGFEKARDYFCKYAAMETNAAILQAGAMRAALAKGDQP